MARIITEPTMDFHTPLWYAEHAVRQYLIDQAPHWTASDAWQAAIALDPNWDPESRIYRGRENRDDETMEGQESSIKLPPCVTCSCTIGQSLLDNFGGLWTAALDIQIDANRAKTTGDAADAQAQAVFRMFLTRTIIPDLSGVTAGFSVRGVIPKDIGLRAEGRRWVTQMSFSLEQLSAAI